MMRWFDSDFDYVQEMIDAWNNGRKRIRTIYLILGALLLIAGILTAVFPIGIFAVIQYLAAVAVIGIGIYHFITFAVYDILLQGLYADHIRYTETC